MREPTDNQVWSAVEARQNEAKTWRIIEFNDRGAVAVNDRRSITDITWGDVKPLTEAYEHHNFEDAATARLYVEWRSIKAALIAYERTRG